MDSKHEEDTTVLQIWGIPRRLKMLFKVRCVQQGISMKDAIVKAMKKFISESRRKKNVN